MRPIKMTLDEACLYALKAARHEKRMALLMEREGLTSDEAEDRYDAMMAEQRRFEDRLTE